MKIVNLIDEDFVNYKKASMFIAMPYCDFKCNKDCGKEVCQNMELAHTELIDMKIDDLIARYVNNPITSAIVFGGLEPFYTGIHNSSIVDHISDIGDFMFTLRDKFNCKDDVVFYSGYTEDELFKAGLLKWLTDYGNIVIKFGRYRPGDEPHYDEVLGVNLASKNQYAKYYKNNDEFCFIDVTEKK